LPADFTEHVDQELVGRAEEIGELEVFGAQPVAAEVTNEVPAGVVRDDSLVALHPHEADVVENVLERLIALGEGAEGLVQHASVGLGGVAQARLEIPPAGALGDKEAVVEVRVLAVLFLGFVNRHSLPDLAVDDTVVFAVKHVGAALQEEQPEDVVLVRRSIQALLAEAVGRGVEVAFELGKRELGHRFTWLLPLGFVGATYPLPAWLLVLF
jgi:hypothetical protein